MLAVLSLPLTPFFSFLSFLHAVNGAAEGHQWRPSRSQETVELASRHNIDSKVLNRQIKARSLMSELGSKPYKKVGMGW